MKGFFKKAISIMLAAVMLFGVAPLSGLVGLELPEFNLFTPKASAATYSGSCGTNAYWSLDTETGVLTITGHGGMKNFNNTNSYNKDYMTPWVYYDYEIYVKSVVVSEGITSIGDDAFGWLPNLSNVSLPSTLTRIGSRAFYACDSLKDIEIPESVETIGHEAFYSSGIYDYSPTYAVCVGNWMVDTLYYSGYVSVEIPDGIENIADYAFSNSGDDVRTVYIPQSVKYIGYRAFSSRPSTYYYAGGIEDWCNIDMYDEYSNPMIYTKSIYFNNVLLEEIIVPDGVTEIKKHVFANMTNINNISIPDSVTSIGKDAFYNTGYYNNNSNWENGALYIDNHLIKANNSISESYNIKDGTICIADYACYNLSAPKVIRIPSSVKTIGEWAFTGCTSLTRVIMNEGLERIGNGAFAISKLIISLTIPSSVKYIGDYAFQLCEGMTSFTFADNSQLSYLGIAAFANCKALTEISLPDGITEISDELFSECVVLKSVNMPDYITKIGDKAFYNCNKLDTVTIPNGTKSIGDNAFAYCYYLPNITLPDSLELLGNAAFYHCSNSLTQIIIPGSVKIISEDAFYRCYALTSVSINEGSETIRTEAFMSCSALSEINLPDSIIAIEKNAFYDTKYYGNNSNWVDGKVLYIDNHLIQANTSISGDYNVASGTKSIADYAFNGCSSLTGITIPESVVAIGDYAFNGCSSVETVHLPSTIKNIGEYSFEGALYLNDVYYSGGEKDWEKIEIAPNNAYLLNAYLHFAYHYITWVVDGTETTERIAVGDTVNVPTDPAKDYYTFSGWDKQAPATMPEKDYVITAKFTPITYNATFVIDGETFATVPYTVETESIENPVLPKRDGYTEIWEDYTLTPGGITVDAIYTVIIYNAVFTADDKTVSTIPYTVETESITPPEIPEKAGYTSKWADYELAIGGVTVNAIYTPITYYATFVIDGEIVAKIPYTVETESINAPELPVREGYTERWEDYELVIGGVTVNAVYTINPHTVTWIVDNEETTDNYEYGDTIVKPANPEKEGYTFTGWDAEIPATVPDEDLTFTATWKVNNYTVTWNVDGVIKTENYDYGTKLVKPANPVKEGYTFIGWTNDVPATVPANNLEFVAEWSINPHTVTWVVDNEKTTDTYNFGDTIVKPADPEKEGYTFMGWNSEIPATVPDEDLAFTATWKVNNYTVTWNVDGVIKTENYDYGTKIEKPTTPVKEGYTFKDWTISVPETMPATNLDFVATWDINTYTITWNIGDTVETTDFNYGESVVSPEVNVEGYEFIKWIPDVPETMPAENLEFTAMLASTAFDSGWGTEDNPYIISTKEQLDEARNHLGSSFKLANDIVFTENDFASGGAFYNSGRGWTPIHLNGTFDGNGHVIKGLKINARITASTEYPYVGLFGLVSGTIKNLGLIDGEINVTITNANEAAIGAIVAFADVDSKITNCFNTCDIKITSTRTITVNSSNRKLMDAVAVGGIIGVGPARISNCFNNGDVSIDSSVKVTPNSYYTAEIDIMPIAGGITGGSSKVENSYNTGDVDVNVTATRGGTSTFTPKDYLSLSAMAGGVSGMMSDVTNSYNEGNVNATITDDYNSSNKLNIAIGGGIAAGVNENKTVTNCYNTGKVTGTTLSAAIAAYSEGTVKDCYYLNNNDVGVGYGEDVTVPCTPEEMASESTYEGFDFDGTWVIGANGTPKLGSNIIFTEKVEISEANLSVANKETAQLTADLVPTYSTYNGIIWSSSNEEVATVDENGLITAKKIGETAIKATSADGKAFAECVVTVIPADFTITWIVDGKETEETVTETNTIVKPETPVKYGYTFSGWTPEVPDVMPDESLTFNGSFVPVECELVFDATIGAFADGTTKKTETVDFDTQINAPEAPSKAGYIFLGWALDNVNVGTDLGIMDDVEGKRFTAVWVPSTDTRYAVETYTMNTEGEYVKTVQNFTGETDSTANAEYNIKTGFTLNDEKSVLSGTITADNSLVLKVYIDRNKYTFAMVVDGVSTETEYYYESVIAEPATPSKTGYTFIDWDKSVPASMPAKDVTITAEFDANSYDAIFNANGGKWSDGLTSKTAATDFDSEIIAPANPTRQGYDFAGWDNEIGIMDDVNGKTFNAKWNARNDTKYTVEVYTMGTDGKYFVSRETETGTTDTEVSASPTESTGFTFNSAKSTLSGNIAADGSLVLSIYYDRNTYTFATVIDEKTTSYDYYFDATVIKPANPVKPGYKFIGWDNTIPSKMPANDVTVTAKFELSFKMSIRNPSTTTIKYGDKIILHADMNEALPSGWTIKWTADNGNFSYSVSADGSTCTISPSKSGSTNFKATVYDEKGNVFCEDTQSMTSKAGLFDKIGAFFRKLFGSTKTIPQLFKGIF